MAKMSPAKAQKPPASQRPLRVLIVEDMPADAELVVALLKRAGYPLAFEIVDTSALLQQRLSEADWDLVLSDHNLRTWTGMDALEMVRHSGRDTPFIVVTATLGDEAAVEYIKQGAADYVLKHRLERLPVAVGAVLRERAHRAEAARLQEQIFCAKREWELTFDTVPDPVFVLDDECRVQRCNRAASDILGLDFSQVQGRPCYEVIHGRTEQRPDCPHALLLQSGVAEHGDLEEPRLGKVFHSTCTPLRDPSGGLRGCVQVMRDVTERRRAEEALRRSETRFRELVENATYGIYQSTPDGRFLDVNSALVSMLGYASREELLAANLMTDVYLHPPARASILDDIRKTGYAEGIEVEWKRKDGKPILARLSGRAVRDERGEISHFEAIAEDVTERRAMEKQIAALQKFEAIGQLAGGIAHDFNNVIGTILGWAEVGIEEAPPGSRLHSHFGRIRDQAQRAAGLTRQLLAFARRQILEPRNMSLNELVSEVTGFLRKTIPANVELKLLLARDLATIRADPTQMEQILMNLCLNARDALAGKAAGQLVVETKNVEIDHEYGRFHIYAKPGRYALLTVSDNGAGMDAATQERIFEPFFTTKETGKGTGLGLATVYGIVKQHNGFINVYSELGHGTTFRVYLPAVQAVAEEIKPADAEPVRGGNETILVAEDHEGGREMVYETLGKLGYTVLTAANGEEAVRVFEANRETVDLLLLDVVMPKLSGPEAFHRIEAIRPGLPVVFATGYSSEAEILDALSAEHRHLVQKPYSPRAIARKVRELLDATEKV
jgi:PAS domain S-box-containing protein